MKTSAMAAVLVTRGSVAVLLSVLAVALLPLWLPGYQINIVTQILIYAVMAIGLNIMVGFSGLISLGHAAFFSVAAYATAILLASAHSHTVAVSVALALTILTTAICAILSLNSSGIGFLMITLAFGQVVWGLAYRWISMTNGDNGIVVGSRPEPFGLSLVSPNSFFYATLLIFCIVMLVAYLFVNSPLGTSLRGARDEPRRMSALGYNVWAVRFFSFLLSGLITGIAGVLFVYHTKFISPQSAGLSASAESLLMVIAGGAGTLTGPVVGAALIVLMDTVASDYIARWNALLGTLFIAIVIFMPEGIVPGVARLLHALRPAKGAGQPSGRSGP